MRHLFFVLLLLVALIQTSVSSATPKKVASSKNNPSYPRGEFDDKGGDVILLPSLSLFSKGEKNETRISSATNKEEQKGEEEQNVSEPQSKGWLFFNRKQKERQKKEESTTAASSEIKNTKYNRNKKKSSLKRKRGSRKKSEVKTKSSSTLNGITPKSKKEKTVESTPSESNSTVKSEPLEMGKAPETNNKTMESAIQTVGQSSENAKEGHSISSPLKGEEEKYKIVAGTDKKKEKRLNNGKMKPTGRWFSPKRKRTQKQSTLESKERKKDPSTTISPSAPDVTANATSPHMQADNNVSSTTGNSTSILYLRPPPPHHHHQQGSLQQPQQSMLLLSPGPQQQQLQQQGRPGPAQITGSAVIASYTLSLLSTIIRLWFLTSLTKWFQEEESVRPTQHFVWERLNDKYVRDTVALSNAISAAPAGVSERKWRRIQRKQQMHLRIGKRLASTVQQQSAPIFGHGLPSFDRTVLVVEVKPNGEGGMDLKHLKSIVTFLLAQHRQHAFGSRMVGETVMQKPLEVVLLVESPGGVVQDFGLAASEVGRLSNEKGISTTVCVDNIAASGGYMIASQAHQLCAAPFAIVGSIGVIRESFNLNGALERQGVKGVVLKAGHSKAPISMFGPLTKEDVRTAQNVIDKIHKAFQLSVTAARPALVDSVEAVCNGDIYLGMEAKELSLVDRVVTSEEYLFECIAAGDRVLKLHRSHQAKFGKHRFSPLDFIRHKSLGALRAAWNNVANTLGGETGDALSTLIHAGSLVGFAQYLFRHRLL